MSTINERLSIIKIKCRQLPSFKKWIIWRDGWILLCLVILFADDDADDNPTRPQKQKPPRCGGFLLALDSSREDRNNASVVPVYISLSCG
jgi:hypothetical protein